VKAGGIEGRETKKKAGCNITNCKVALQMDAGVLKVFYACREIRGGLKGKCEGTTLRNS